MLSADGALCLVDFALSESVAEIRPEFTHQAVIAGTLAYLAPESTGPGIRCDLTWPACRCRRIG